MGRLTPHAAVNFQRHWSCCPTCARVAKEQREFLSAIRAALRELEQTWMYRCPPLVFQSSVSVPPSTPAPVRLRDLQYRVRIAAHRCAKHLPGVLLIGAAPLETKQ